MILPSNWVFSVKESMHAVIKELEMGKIQTEALWKYLQGEEDY
jgi:hypothetical protein